MTGDLHSARRILQILLVLALGVGGLGPSTVVTSGDAAGTADIPGLQSFAVLSCPSVSICYAGGDHGVIFATRDGGSAWQLQSSGRDEWGGVESISCPTISVCFASIASIAAPLCDVRPGASPPPVLLRTTDGGNIWTSAPYLPECTGSNIACPSVTTCYVFSWLHGGNPSGTPVNDVFRTTDGGGSWQLQGTIGGLGQLLSLSCPSTLDCYFGTIAAIGRSTDGGHTWQISDFSCAGEAICRYFDSIACPSQRICYAGAIGHATHMARCASVNTMCLARDLVSAARPYGVVAATKDGGATWQQHRLRGLGPIGALSCPTTTRCVALSTSIASGCYGCDPAALGRVATTTDSGTTWRVNRVRQHPFAALTCPSAMVCYVSGYLGRLMRTANRGTTWTDLIPAIFVSGTYGPKQPLHTYSRWFTATQPWQITLGVPGPDQQPGPDVAVRYCDSSDTIEIAVRDAAGRIVAGPIHVALHPNIGFMVASKESMQATGRLRLDVVSPCSTFSVRLDGVK